MFIDALTPIEPPPPTGPVSEHNGGPKLGVSAAQADLHARVHGDGTSCPVCQLRVITATGALPLPASIASQDLSRHRRVAHRTM